MTLLLSFTLKQRVRLFSPAHQIGSVCCSGLAGFYKPRFPSPALQSCRIVCWFEQKQNHTQSLLGLIPGYQLTLAAESWTFAYLVQICFLFSSISLTKWENCTFPLHFSKISLMCLGFNAATQMCFHPLCPIIPLISSRVHLRLSHFSFY